MPRILRAWEGFILHRWRSASVLRRPPRLSSSWRSPFLIKPLQTKHYGEFWKAIFCTGQSLRQNSEELFCSSLFTICIIVAPSIPNHGPGPQCAGYHTNKEQKDRQSLPQRPYRVTTNLGMIQLTSANHTCIFPSQTEVKWCAAEPCLSSLIETGARSDHQNSE